MSLPSSRPSAAAAGPAAAYLTATGELTEHHDGRGRRLLEAEPDLIRHLRMMLGGGVDRVRFLWRGTDSWLAVSALRLPSGDDEPATALATVDVVITPPHGLTPRELDVLTLLAGGLSNPEIAAHLGTSDRTVSTQVATILEKLTQVSRAGAASIAVEDGLLRLPVPGGGHAIAGLAVGKIDIAARADGSRPRLVPPSAPRTRLRPLLIGSVLPLNGPMGADGREMHNGAQLAIADINARGGIAGRPIEQLVVDVDLADPDAINAGISRLVEAEVDAITTGYTFADNMARYDAVADYGCPLLTTETSELQAEWVRSDHARLAQVFQVGPTEAHYVSGFVHYLSDLADSGRWRPRNRRVIVVETTLPGGHVCTPAAIDAIERSGWELDSVHQVGGFDIDWSAVLERVREVEPAAVMVAHFVPSEVAGFQRAFVEEPTDTLVYGVYAQSVPEYADLAGTAADGVLWGTVTGSYSDQIGSDFARRYEARYGVVPGRSQAGLSYDQVSLLGIAWARVGNSRRFAAVGDELRRVAHRGINGTYVLGHDRQCGLTYPYDTPDPSLGQAHLVFQLQSGGNRIVHPALYADSVFRVPHWFSA